MLKKIKVRFKGEDFSHKDKMDILANNVCDSILPVSISRNEGIIYGYYDTTAYRRLSSYRELSAINTMTVLERIVEAMEGCSQYLFFVEEYVISLDTVYIDGRFEKVKFAYVLDCDKIGLNKKLIYLVNQLKTITTEAGAVYLNTVKHFLEREELSLLKLKLLVIVIKREIQMQEIN